MQWVGFICRHRGTNQGVAGVGAVPHPHAALQGREQRDGPHQATSSSCLIPVVHLSTTRGAFSAIVNNTLSGLLLGSTNTRSTFDPLTTSAIQDSALIVKFQTSSYHRDPIHATGPPPPETPTMAGDRSSSEEDRKLEAGIAQAPESPPSSGGGLHPAFYIALWIFLSSSIILFNKWILTTAKFSALPPPLFALPLPPSFAAGIHANPVVLVFVDFRESHLTPLQYWKYQSMRTIPDTDLLRGPQRSS